MTIGRVILHHRNSATIVAAGFHPAGKTIPEALVTCRGSSLSRQLEKLPPQLWRRVSNLPGNTIPEALVICRGSSLSRQLEKLPPHF